jgi:nucleoside-diphosphate-sugar epimerase
MKTLVTGATGFLGSYLVRALIARGDSVRILARSAERARALAAAGAQVRIGDLAEPATLSGIADGIDVVFHLARSVTEGSDELFERVDVQGTERLIAEAERAGAQRLVYVGTLAGYPLAQQPDGAVIDERSALDETGLLGNYVRAKARAEQVVLAASTRGKLESVIVRLGLVCGLGTSVLPAHVCLALNPGRVILFGDGSVPLPLVYVDNAVDALILGATVPGISGQSFNIVDEDVLTQREYLELLQRSSGGRPQVIRAPRLAYYALGLLTEIAAAARHKAPATNRYRIKSRLRRVRWDSSKARDMLKWRTRVPLRTGLAATFRAVSETPATSTGRS